MRTPAPPEYPTPSGSKIANWSIGLSLACLVALGIGYAFWNTRQTVETLEKVDHAQQERIELGRMLVGMVNAETQARGFELTGREEFLDLFLPSLGEVRRSLGALRSLTTGDAGQRRDLDETSDAIEQKLALMQQQVEERRLRAHIDDEPLATAVRGKAFMDSIRAHIAQMEKREDLVLAQRYEAARRALEATIGVVSAGSALLVALLALAVWRARRERAARAEAQAGLAERRKAEAALRLNEERLRLLVDNVKDYALFMLDPEGRVATWNAGAERSLGYKAEEIVGKHISVFFPEDAAAACEPESELAKAAADGRVEHEGWRLRKDGARFFATAIVTAIRDDEHRLVGFAKITRDITERKRLEDLHGQFRALFESLPGLFLVLTPDFQIAASSDEYLKATMTRREEIVGRNLFEVFPDNPDDPQGDGVSNLRASLERVRESGQPDVMPIQRYDVRGPDGEFEERYWSPINSAILDRDRGIEYFVHRVEDVTAFMKHRQSGDPAAAHVPDRLEIMEAEIYRSSERVRTVNQELRAANAELESFSYSVSHDLRAPLRHIDGFADLLSQHAASKLDDKGRRYLKVISDSAKRMGVLIDDLLSFSRMGRAEMHRAKVDLGALTDEVISSVVAEANGRPLVWKRQELPVVEGDAALLRQVLVNLISNAVKYSRPRDPAVIEIGCDNRPSEKIVYIRDNGVGFDMAYASKLFGVFQRLHRAEEFEGTGIGLANVRRIVQRHGGRTWAEGQLSTGSTFYFSLPIGMEPSAKYQDPPA